MDLPGFTKDEVKVSLENGYLTVSASKGLDKDEKEKKSGKYIRRERYAGVCPGASMWVTQFVPRTSVRNMKMAF